MIVRHRFRVSRSYFITALTYYIFQDQGREIKGKAHAMEIVRDRFFWSGQGNWNGDLMITEALGDGGDAIDVYNELQPQIEKWVSDNFPKLK